MNDEFARLFKYIEEFRGEMNQKLDEKASQSSLDRLINTVDAFVKRLDDAETEQAARDHKIERLERWIQEVAESTGVKLST